MSRRAGSSRPFSRSRSRPPSCTTRSRPWSARRRQARKLEPDADPREPAQLRLLLAEDNAVNRQLALLLLEKLGYRAEVALNGLEALEALRRQPGDVVLMAVEMRERAGLGAARRIHREWP